MPYRQHIWMGGVSQDHWSPDDVMKNINARCGATGFDICPSGSNFSLGTVNFFYAPILSFWNVIV